MAKQNKDKMVSFRLSSELEEKIEAVRVMLSKQKPPGGNEVTRSEAIQVLLDVGSKHLLVELNRK